MNRPSADPLIDLSDRHGDYTQEEHAYAQGKAERLCHFFRRTQSMHVTLWKEHDDEIAKIVAHTPERGVLVAEVSSPSIRASVDQVYERMERELTRTKERFEKRGRASA